MIGAQFAAMRAMPPGARQVLIETDIGVVRWRRVYAGHAAREAAPGSEAAMP